MGTNLFSIESKGRTITITLNHPPTNVLSTETLTQLDHILSQIEADPTYKVVILASTGQFFCLGADIREIQHLQTAQQGKEFSVRGHALLNRIENLDIPAIAVIQGACLGGGLELAMACHMRLAAKEASFGLPEITLGFIPGFGGTQRLPRIIGPSKATELILTGKILSADEAVAIGLISEVLPASKLMLRVQALAEAISEKGGLAIRAALRAIRSARVDFSKADFAREAELFGELCETRDAKEGLQAFLEKRSPHFKDQ